MESYGLLRKYLCVVAVLPAECEGEVAARPAGPYKVCSHDTVSDITGIRDNCFEYLNLRRGLAIEKHSARGCWDIDCHRSFNGGCGLPVVLRRCSGGCHGLLTCGNHVIRLQHPRGGFLVVVIVVVEFRRTP